MRALALASLSVSLVSVTGYIAAILWAAALLAALVLGIIRAWKEQQ